jgi:hypothetical protein
VLCALILLMMALLGGVGCEDRMLKDETSETLRATSHDAASNRRPPVLLIPGLISSRLVAWKRKYCRGPDINIQDIVWLNLKKMVSLGACTLVVRTAGD